MQSMLLLYLYKPYTGYHPYIHSIIVGFQLLTGAEHQSERAGGFWCHIALGKTAAPDCNRLIRTLNTLVKDELRHLLPIAQRWFHR